MKRLWLLTPCSLASLPGPQTISNALGSGPARLLFSIQWSPPGTPNTASTGCYPWAPLREPRTARLWWACVFWTTTPLQKRGRGSHLTKSWSKKPVAASDWRCPSRKWDTFTCINFHIIVAGPSLFQFDNFGPGRSIRLRGIAPDNGNFVVNIFSGSNPHDILLHFNPRFDERCVVRNSRLAGSWGPEERHGKLVFKQGKKFNIMVTAQPDCFLVMVDDEEFCRFRYRFPLPCTVLVELDCGIDYF